MNKYFVFSIVFGYMLIDREALEFRFYLTDDKQRMRHIHIQNCSIERLSKKRINGLIHLINSGEYGYEDAYAIDKYIYHFLLTKSQKEKCNVALVSPQDLLELNTEDFITSGDDLGDVVREMRRIVNQRALVK